MLLSCNCKLFDGQWPDSGSRFGEREKFAFKLLQRVAFGFLGICLPSYSQVAGEWDVYIDIYGRKLMEKSVDIGQMVGVPFPNECHHLPKDFLVQNCLLPTPESRGGFLNLYILLTSGAM